MSVSKVKFLKPALVALIMLAGLSTKSVLAAPGAPLEQDSIRKLFGQVMKVMEAMHAPLQFSQSQLDELAENAQSLIDPKTKKPFRARHGEPLIYYVIDPVGSCSMDIKRTVLFMGGIHPDEVSPLYTSFHALYMLLENPYARPENTRVIYIPLANPEGLIESGTRLKVTTRENSEGKDLNRGFEESDKKTMPEVAFVKALIAKYNPSHIVTLHAPYGWLDYDGPAKLPHAPADVKKEVEEWETQVSRAGAKPLPVAKDFGSYRGSMGNYGGYRLHKHVLTIEYPSTEGRKAEEEWRDYGGSLIQSLNPPMHNEPTPPMAYDVSGQSLHLRASMPGR
ncbi:MAG: succinylglutamate desuccinylase/aspartoacylase family protein [Deltaproteobacteria bacterium]|nr:succinylglutamate desuccinylase/aspartoacylase family protein [Deltaproteobacteria bacterium]